MQFDSVYTFIQFYRILYFLILMIILSIVIPYFYLKSKTPKFIKRLLYLYGSLLLIIIFRVIEEIIYINELSIFFRCMQDILINLLISIWIIHVNTYLNRKITGGIVYLAIVLLWIIINFYNSYYIFEYSKDAISYHKYYTIIVTIGMILKIFYSLLYVYNYDKDIKYAKLRKIFLSVSINIITIAYVLNLYGFSLTFIEMHFLAFSISIILVSVVILKYYPNEISPTFINEIVDNMMETIIVSDENGKIMYINNTDIKPFINTKEKIKNQTIMQIFNDKAKVELLEIVNSCEIILLHSKSGDIYLNCSMKKITQNKSTIGYVYIINDITSFKKLLNNLSEKNKKLNNIYKELETYSDIANLIETEKECERLMNELKKSLDRSFKILIYNMKKSIKAIENKDELGEIYLDESINIARKHLELIRNTVNQYKNIRNN